VRFLSIILSILLICETSQAKQKTEILKSTSFDQIKSIMLNDKEMSKINKAIDFFGQGKEFVAEVPIGGKEGITDEERANIKLSKEMKLIQEKSQIYLGSILYFSDKVWSVWLNNKKITSFSNNPRKEIFIKKIDGQKIKIIWTIGISKWKILMGRNNDSSSLPKTNELSQVKVKFSLRPNQTYSLREAKITEGKKVDKVVSTAKKPIIKPENRKK
jgi:hypothetical protein